MGDCSAGRAGERFLAEFGDDYRQASGLRVGMIYVVETHGLVYDDFHREVKYSVTLQNFHSEADEKLEVILDQPAAYDTEVHDPVDEICRVARDLDLPVFEVFKRFKRADLVPDNFTLADFPAEVLKEMSA